MRITEGRLRRIIREVILEENQNLNESLSTLKAALLAAGITFTTTQFANFASSLNNTNTSSSSSSSSSTSTSSYKGKSGEALDRYIIDHIDEIPDSDLNDIAAAMRTPSGSAAQRSSKLHRHRDAKELIRQRFDQAPEEFNKDTMRSY